MTPGQAVHVLNALNKRRAREDRLYFQNMASVMGREIKFPEDENSSPVDGLPLASDDLTEDQKVIADKAMQTAIDRKRQEMGHGK